MGPGELTTLPRSPVKQRARPRRPVEPRSALARQVGGRWRRHEHHGSTERVGARGGAGPVTWRRSSGSGLRMQEIVRQVLTARVYDVATQTPLDAMPRLSERLGRPVRLKREDLQPVFSFKLRGAYNKVAAMGDDARRAGVICASAGNHAQGVAVAAARHGVEATV